MCFSSLVALSVYQKSKTFKQYSLLNLVSNLCRGIHCRLALISSQLRLLLAHLLRPLCQLGHRRQVKVRVEMPKQRARDSHQRPIGKLDLAPLNGLNGALVDDDLVISGLDEPAGDVFDLLAGLDEEVVALGDLDGDAGSRVAGPDIEAGVARTAVDGEEVEVGVEAGENCVEGGVFVEVGGGRSEEMGTVLEIE